MNTNAHMDAHALTLRNVGAICLARYSSLGIPAGDPPAPASPNSKLNDTYSGLVRPASVVRLMATLAASVGGAACGHSIMQELSL
jgi:hypothetical protein